MINATPSNILAARYDAYMPPAHPVSPMSDIERMEHIEHIANRGAPLPADEALWLLGVARGAISDRDECQRLITMCVDTIATASDTLAAIIPADSTDNERNEA